MTRFPAWHMLQTVRSAEIRAHLGGTWNGGKMKLTNCTVRGNLADSGIGTTRSDLAETPEIRALRVRGRARLCRPLQMEIVGFVLRYDALTNVDGTRIIDTSGVYITGTTLILADLN
jgi:hypothetical protein